MDFDPKEYAKDEAAFDPAAYAAEPSDIPKSASASAGFISSLPGVSAVGAAGKTAMDVLSGGTSIGDAVGEYRNQRDILRGHLEKTQEANPKSALVGNIAGGSLLPIGKGISGLAKYGALAGAANSKADLTKGEFRKTAEDAITGGTEGAAIGGAVETMSPVARFIGSKLRRFSEKTAEAATGATDATIHNKFADNSGAALLDRPDIIKWWNSQGDIAKNARAALDKSGKKIGGALEGLDAKGGQITRDELLANVNENIAKLSRDGKVLPAEAGTVRQLKSIAEDIASGPEKYSLSEGEGQKRGFQKLVNWMNPDKNPSNALASDVYKTAVEKNATALDPALAKDFSASKSEYGLLRPITEAAEKRASGGGFSGRFNLHNLSTGGIGAAAGAHEGYKEGGIGGALGGAALGALAGPRLPALLARSTNGLSKIISTAPEKLGPYAAILSQASAAGPEKLALVNAMLQKTDKVYRSLIQRIAK
jgi:hypothetical protein